VRVRILVNPVASSVSPRRVERLRVALAREHRVDVVDTVARGHARTLAGTAADEGVDVVVVAAGDGTLNEAANGLLGSPTALAPYPGGSTNVYARAVGYGNHPDRATDRLVDALTHGSIRHLGVGAAGERRFLFHLGAGFDAAVVARMEARHRNQLVKRYAAHPAFALATLRTLARSDRSRPTIRVEAPGLAPHDSHFTVVSNLAPYSYVGPRRMVLTRGAGPDRALALTSMQRFGLSDVAAAFGSSVARAAHLRRDPDVVQWEDLGEITLHGVDDQPFPWQVDGDHLGSTDSLTVRFEPKALAVVLPRWPAGPPSAP